MSQTQKVSLTGRFCGFLDSCGVRIEHPKSFTMIHADVIRSADLHTSAGLLFSKVFKSILCNHSIA